MLYQLLYTYGLPFHLVQSTKLVTLLTSVAHSPRLPLNQHRLGGYREYV